MNDLTLFREFRRLVPDAAAIGLEAGEETSDWFCTPEDASVLGWDGCIHYCRVAGFGDTVFCVNPENFGDRLVYPLARSFRDFLSLIAAAGHANALQQIILWNRAEYEAFLQDPEMAPDTEDPQYRQAHDAIRQLKIAPADDPFGYVKALQRDFDGSALRFSDEYYDTLGLERPDGSAPAACTPCAPADIEREE